jgi:hypothetical protein
MSSAERPAHTRCVTKPLVAATSAFGIVITDTPNVDVGACRVHRDPHCPL